MQFVAGEILTINGFQKGYLGFEKSTIVDVGRGVSPQKPLARGLIVPGLVNAHTHIGDSFIRRRNVKLPKDIIELVAPPDGLKHRLLREASEDEIVDGIRISIDEMTRDGVSCFCDFRENGMKGINLLINALENRSISPLIFSRPSGLKYDMEEVELLLKNSDGIGVSSISDWDYPELEKVVQHTKKRRKMFGMHASERIREEIDPILNLKPNCLVHMVYATESDLFRVKDSNIPIVVCPRSNDFYGLKPDIELMKKVGVDLLLGTDNAMLNTPSILDEIKYLKKLSKKLSIQELLYMVTYKARKALNLDCNILGLNSRADFVVLDKKSLKPLYISVSKLEG